MPSNPDRWRFRKRLSRLRNALAHGQYICWKAVVAQRLLGIRVVLKAITTSTLNGSSGSEAKTPEPLLPAEAELGPAVEPMTQVKRVAGVTGELPPAATMRKFTGPAAPGGTVRLLPQSCAE